MVKENKDFFMYILGIVVLFVATLVIFGYIIPSGSGSGRECGFLGINCFINKTFRNEKTYSKPSEMTIDTNKDYRAVVKTNKGDFEIDLYEKDAPVTVNNFVFLANEKYFDNVKFHRVIRGMLVQTGDRNTLNSDKSDDGKGGPGYTLADEINWESLDFSEAKIQQLTTLGFTDDKSVTSQHLDFQSVAMANSGPNTNGSQFFIVTAMSDDPTIKGLEGRHTVFGKVVSGWEVIDTIQNTSVDDPTSNSPRPLEDIVIMTVEIKVI
jgi:cyclophilin family peptidyl-prolyl cis-trans isomerase